MLPDDEIAAFFSGGVSISIASRNVSWVPSISRAKGCRIVRGSPTRIRVFVSQAHAGECLEDIRISGMISATFSWPSTHRTLQFKGSDARIDALTADDHAAMSACEAAFAALIQSLGFDRTFTDAFAASPADELAIEFTPTDAFQQTPGPGAGARLP